MTFSQLVDFEKVEERIEEKSRWDEEFTCDLLQITKMHKDNYLTLGVASVEEKEPKTRCKFRFMHNVNHANSTKNQRKRYIIIGSKIHINFNFKVSK